MNRLPKSKRRKVWSKAVEHYLQSKDYPVSGKDIIAYAEPISPENQLRKIPKVLAQTRQCPNLFQLSRWCKNHPNIIVTQLKVKSTMGSTFEGNHYEWVENIDVEQEYNHQTKSNIMDKYEN